MRRFYIKKTRWSEDALREAVKNNGSVRQVIKQLGLIAAGGNYGNIKRHIKELGLDTSHF
jgi:TPP-dependent indolepyruvate ferredoxin oxidoreductase alpha subunit